MLSSFAEQLTLSRKAEEHRSPQATVTAQAHHESIKCKEEQHRGESLGADDDGEGSSEQLPEVSKLEPMLSLAYT